MKFCVYEECEGVMSRVGHQYVNLEKAVRFATNLQAAHVEIRSGLNLAAIKIKGKLVTVAEVLS